MENFVSFVARVAMSAAVVLVVGCGETTTDASTRGVSCDAAAVDSTFGDSCAAGLADVFLCWSPDGDCTVDGFTTTYANGSSLMSSLDGTLQFRGPNGEQCGTATSMFNTGATQEISFLTRSNETYVYEIDTVTEDLTVVCPSGERVTVDTEQAAAVSACGTSANQISICENVNVGDPGDPGDIGNIAEDCTDDSQCPDAAGIDFVCCQAISACLPKISCDYL